MLAAFLSAALMAMVFLLHCAVVGSAALAVLCGPGRVPLAAFFSICLGMPVNMAALFVLGVAGALHLPAVAAVALSLLAGATAIRIMRGRGRQGSQRAAPASWLEAATLVLIFLLCIGVSVHPPGHWDDTMYQLPLARHYVEHQAIVLHEYVRFPLFPQNMNLLFALGLMLGDATTAAAPGTTWQFGAPEVYAQVFATLPLFVMALGLWGASRRFLCSGIPGLLAGLTLFMIGPIKSSLGFAYVDNGLAMFCLAAALVVALSAEAMPSGDAAPPRLSALNTHSGSLPFMAGLLAGGACGIKYFGVVFAAGLGVVLAAITVLSLIRRGSVSAAAELGSNTGVADTGMAAESNSLSGLPIFLRSACLYGLGVLLTGSAWYVRSYVVSGDPAHPAGAPIFGFFLWNEGDLAVQYAEQAEYGTGANPLKWPLALREGGVLLWLPAFAGLFLRRVPAAIRALQAAFLAYMLFWFFVSQVPRYLGPVYGLGGFLAFHALHRAWQWLRQRGAQTAVAARITRLCPSGRAAPAFRPAALVLILAVAYTADRGTKYGKEYLNAEQVLQTNPGYTLYQHANAHIPELGARLLQVGFENGIYYFQGTVVGEWFGRGRYRDILQCERLPCPLPLLSDLQATLRHHDARMLLLSRRQVVDFNEVALQVAGWRVLAENEQGTLLAAPD